MGEHTVRYALLKHADEVESYTDTEDTVEVFRSTYRPHTTPTCSPCCKLSVSVSAIAVVAVCSTLAVVYHTTMNGPDIPPSSPLNTTSSQCDWETQIPGAGSSSPLRAYDVNGDGILDVILGTNFDQVSASQCQADDCVYAGTCSQGACDYGMMALNGLNGTVLWQIYTKHEIFELTCPAIDIDSDGLLDCIASGRSGTLLAFNPRSCEVYWLSPPDINSKWNVFAPGIVRDVDGDGVEELVAINGGDPSYPAEVHDREASYMLLLSGRTGKTIGRQVFTMPDNRESYSMPMIYTTDDNCQYVLFGTGGETIPGGLYIISLKHLLAHVSPQSSYEIAGNYSHWVEREESSGVITLYKTAKTGIIVPASFADLNNDGVRDIIALTFDGILLAFSGKDLSYIWQPKNFTLTDVNTQSYTSPAFGYFNDDDTLDIMVHWQTGNWPSYDTFMIYIIDGRDGELLWYKDTPLIFEISASSPLVLSTTLPYSDIFVTRITSTNVPFPESSQPLNRSDMAVSKRHFEADTSDAMSNCEHVDEVFVDTVLVDRGSSTSPLLLYRQHSTPYYYNVTEELISHRLKYVEDDSHTYSHQMGRRHSADEPSEAEAAYDDVVGTVRCVRSNLQAIPAGILTDVDANGVMDYITVDVSYTKLSVRDGELTGDIITKLTVRKFSLDKLHLLPRVNLKEVLTRVTTPQHPPAKISLAPPSHHKWSQMFGSSQDGSY